MELIKERHADGILAANAQAQIRKLMAARASRVEGMFSTLIPKPALMRKRLEQTGKDISARQICAWPRLGLAGFVAALLMLKGAPFLLAFFVGLFAGVGDPALRRRLPDQAPRQQVQFELPGRDRADGPRPSLGPADHRDAWHRRRRNRRPGRTRVPRRRRQDEDRPDDGSRAAGNLGPARHRRVPVLRHHPGDPARDRRQSWPRPCRTLPTCCASAGR